MSVIQGDIGGGGGSDASLTFSDITTNDASTTKHGFLLKLAGTSTKFLRDDGSWQTIAGGGDALVANPLSQFAATTSAQLRSVLTDETGTGAAVFATSPTLVTPALGVASATTVNKVTVTAPATGSTLTIADGKTLTVSNDATVSGTNTGDVANTAVTTGKLSQFAATTSAELAGVISDETGSGALVFGTSPTLTTPTLGVATVTTVNKVAITAPASGSTLVIADGATLTASATATVSGTNTGDQTISDATISTSDITTNNFSTTKHGFVPKGTNVGNFLKDDGAWAAIPGGGDALTSNPLSQFAATTSLQLKGVMSDETGSGALVFGTSPTLTTPDIGAATATTVNKITITAPATGATLTISDGKTLTVSNNATVSGTNTGDQTITGRLIGVQVLTSGSGATYTPTAGTASAVVEGWACGGGGGGVAAANASQAAIACGGGSGGYFCHRYSSITTGTYTVSSTGGAAGNNAGAAAGDGSDTTFTDGTTLLTAKGGKGAQAGVGTGTSTTVLAGAAGGAISTNGNIRNIGGTGGGDAIRTGTGGANSCKSGYGGGPNGGDMRGTSGAGQDAKGYGGGGGGALALSSGAAAVGGAGGAGVIIVWEYSS